MDLGDGVLAVEFHSKMNAIGGDTLQMLHAGIREATANFEALVVGGESPAFSAGANLMLLLLEAQEGNWDEIDLMVRAFQGATSAIRYADVPVVVAPGGLALGGGCEVVLHGDRVQAAAEAADTFDIQAIAELDRLAFGADRRRLIAYLAEVGEFAVIRRDGRVSGFAALRAFGRGEVIGPIVSGNLDDAKALVQHFIAVKTGRFLRVDTTADTGLSPWLAEYGLAHVGGGIAMMKPAG